MINDLLLKMMAQNIRELVWLAEKLEGVPKADVWSAIQRLQTRVARLIDEELDRRLASATGLGGDVTGG